MLNKETLNELAGILREDYGQNYSPKEVFEIAQGIVGLFDNLLELDRKDKNDNKNEYETKWLY